MSVRTVVTCDVCGADITKEAKFCYRTKWKASGEEENHMCINCFSEFQKFINEKKKVQE